jgi:hypothetical protein
MGLPDVRPLNVDFVEAGSVGPVVVLVHSSLWMREQQDFVRLPALPGSAAGDRFWRVSKCSPFCFGRAATVRTPLPISYVLSQLHRSTSLNKSCTATTLTCRDDLLAAASQIARKGGSNNSSFDSLSGHQFSDPPARVKHTCFDRVRRDAGDVGDLIDRFLMVIDQVDDLTMRPRQLC